MYSNIFIQRSVFSLILFCVVSFAGYADDGVIVGQFCLTPCSDNPSEYIISMNKEAVIDKGYETLHVPSVIKDKGKTYKIVQVAPKGFVNCCFIKELVIDEGIETVGGMAFYGCSDLRSVSFPSSISSLGECIFYNCPELQIIEVNKGNPVFDSREQCNAVSQRLMTPLNWVVQGLHSPKVYPRYLKGLSVDVRAC